MRKFRNDYGPTTHELRKDYDHITDGNYGVLHHFYNYVYGVIRCATLTFFWPLPYISYITNHQWHNYTAVLHWGTGSTIKYLDVQVHPLVWIGCSYRYSL